MLREQGPDKAISLNGVKNTDKGKYAEIRRATMLQAALHQKIAGKKLNRFAHTFTRSGSEAGVRTTTVGGSGSGSWSSVCQRTCRWNCDTAMCNQTCTPRALPQTCQTQCPQVSFDGCFMAATGAPTCTSMCPVEECPSGDCPECSTSCSEAQFQLNCPTQKCTVGCQHDYEWVCDQVEECPQPKCTMSCSQTAECAGGRQALVASHSAVESLPVSNATVRSIPWSQVGTGQHTHLMNVPVKVPVKVPQLQWQGRSHETKHHTLNMELPVKYGAESTANAMSPWE